MFSIISLLVPGLLCVWTLGDHLKQRGRCGGARTQHPLCFQATFPGRFCVITEELDACERRLSLPAFGGLSR